MVSMLRMAIQDVDILGVGILRGYGRCRGLKSTNLLKGELLKGPSPTIEKEED